jgi:hypothetical protein
MSTSSIAGVSLETYAKLCAAMAHTEGDEARELEIAAQAGVEAAAWRAAKEGYTARMSDPADAGQTATAFMPLYQAAQAEARGGGPPCTLELYATISTSYSFEQDTDGEQVPPEVIFARHMITPADWSEYTGYWTPRVNDPTDPVSQEFPKLVQAESDRIFGIHRDANGSRVDPLDEEASAEDRAAAVEALRSARRPVDAPPPPPTAPSQPPLAPEPLAQKPAAPLAPLAQKPPQPLAEQAPAQAPAPELATTPSPPEPPAAAPAAPAVAGAMSDEEERTMAALCHGSAIFAPVVAPLILWLLHKDGKSAFVAHRAKQAAIVQGVVVAVMFITCGLAVFLAPLWWGAEAWLAWKAYEGSREGYPGMAPFSD